MSHTWKNGSLVDKCVTLAKLSPSWKSGWHLEEWVTFGKMSHSWKNCLHLQKRVTLGKMFHPWKFISYLKKWVSLWKVVHTCTHGSHSEKWVTLGKNSLFISCVHASSNSCYSSWACCQIFLCLERHRNEEKRAIYTEVSLSPRLSFKPLITVITAIEQKYYRHAIMAFKCMTWCAPGPLFSNYVQRAIITKPSIKRRTPRC